MVNRGCSDHPAPADSSAVPVLARDRHLTTEQATFALTAASFGMLLGALVAGSPGGRFGRVRTVALGVAVTALAGLAVALAHGIETFAPSGSSRAWAPVASSPSPPPTSTRSHARTAASLLPMGGVPHLGWRSMVTTRR